MIKAIIFDCFGVLTTDRWKEFCATLTNSEILYEAHSLNHQYDSGKITQNEFLEKIRKLTGRSPEIVDVTPDNEISKNTFLLNYISQLKSHYKIGLISNIATNWIRSKFLTPDEVKLFDDMVLSFEVGVTKPDPKIFHIAADRLGVETDECILVDDIDRYCEAAKKEGMKAILYENFAQMKDNLEKLLAAKV